MTMATTGRTEASRGASEYEASGEMREDLERGMASVAAASRTGDITRIDFGGMSSSEILAFMAQVMRDVDGDLAARADVLKSRNAESKQLSDEIAVLERLSTLAERNGDEDLAISGADTADTIDGVTVSEWLRHNDMQHVLQGMERSPRASGEGQIVRGEAIQQAIDDRKSRQNGLNAASEMDMIGFQSVVQTRQLFVNLATQMMNAGHDGQNRIAQNIG
jgi:hypothetical protein